ncbi:SIMPL domain-containing protein [bacterium]|nr:SIMPL domain-containing protein [bacterium]MBU1651687.1 SIMPL domain-containing protein [bacterium]
MEQRNGPIFWGMIGLSIALIISAFIAADAARDVKKANDTISVTGSAKMPVRSDYIIWKGVISSQLPERQSTYQDLMRQKAKLVEYLSEQGIADSMINFQPVGTYVIEERANDRQKTGRFAAYNISQWFEIRSQDVERITELSKKSSELIEQGLNFESHQPEYLISNLADLRSDMLAKASADAHERAVKIAESVGSKVGALRNARVGVFQITARNSTDISDRGMYDTRALEKDITAVVRLTFAIE